MTSPTTSPADLDFAGIRQQYPAAFAALIAWFCADKHFNMGAPTSDTPGEAEAGWGPYLSVGMGKLEAGDFRYDYELAPRDLFDFFDHQRVIVVVYYEMLAYHVSLHIGQDTIWLNSATRATRTTAESAAFMAAFGKLEDRLNQEQG